MRSAPTSRGLSYSTRTPVRVPVPTTTRLDVEEAPQQPLEDRDQVRYDARHDRLVDVAIRCPRVRSSPRTITAYSSDIRCRSVARRHVARTSGPSKMPIVTFVLPISNAASMAEVYPHPPRPRHLTPPREVYDPCHVRHARAGVRRPPPAPPQACPVPLPEPEEPARSSAAPDLPRFSFGLFVNARDVDRRRAIVALLLESAAPEPQVSAALSWRCHVARIWRGPSHRAVGNRVCLRGCRFISHSLTSGLGWMLIGQRRPACIVVLARSVLV